MKLSSRQEVFWKACSEGDLETVRSLVFGVDPNWKNERQHHRTGLHIAAIRFHSAVVEYLLTLPSVDPNSTDENVSVLYSACAWKALGSIRLLLDDPRVLTFSEPKGVPFTWAMMYDSSLRAVEYAVASGKDLGLETLVPGPVHGQHLTVLDLARARHPCAFALLMGYQARPTAVRHRLRTELGWLPRASRFFALVIFACDELLLPLPQHDASPPCCFL